jgi:gluconate 5-dehydrogenase
MSEKKYDVIIVGSGAGGGAVLWRLSEKWLKARKKIGMIEAGDFVLPAHVYNFPQLKGNWKNIFSKVSSPIGKRLPRFSGAEQILALGGRTLFWGAVTPRMHASDFSDWPISKKEMDHYYDIAERIMGILPSGISPQTREILQLLQLNGFEGARTIPQAASDGQTFSSICFLRKAWEQQPFDLAIKSRLLQLRMLESKLIELTVADSNKKIYKLYANKIVLAAGALETPRILLHSGLHGKAFGHYLTTHSFIKAKGEFSGERFGTIVKEIRILIPQTDKTPYQLQLYISKRSISMVCFGKVESHFDNKLTLDPNNKDEFGVPKIKIDFSYSDRDLEVIRQMRVAVKHVLKTLGAKSVYEKLMEPGKDYHETGTCRIGIDPSQSAANRYGQIYGNSGLYAADNSILPSAAAVNPTLTTIALAIRVGDHIYKTY